MPNQNESVTRATVVNDFITKIKTPAYSSAVFWYGNSPTYCNNALLGPRDVIQPTISELPYNGIITAAQIINLCLNYIRATTVYRRMLTGLLRTAIVSYTEIDYGGWFTSSQPVWGYVTDYERTDVCRMSDGYAINYSYDTSLIATNKKISASELNAFYNQLRATAANAQTTAGVVDGRICHSNCHSSCHGSRGRR
jgi:hypothetical protein